MDGFKEKRKRLERDRFYENWKERNKNGFEKEMGERRGCGSV